MIDWKMSAELNDVGEDELRARFVRFPHSNKRVIAICDVCGKERIIKWQDYRVLCNKCAVNTPEAIEANRSRATEYFADQAVRKNVSETRKRYIREHPDSMDTINLGHDIHFLDPAARKDASDAKKRYHIDNPEAGREHSDRLVLYYKNNPEARKKISDGMKNSDAVKAASRKQIGGHDVVGHHMIYDHSDLSKNVMPLTRSMHARLHQLFRKHGIEIPHVNTSAIKLVQEQRRYNHV